MNWKRLKRAIIPLITIKIIIIVFILFRRDVITISRDINYSNNYQAESDSTVQKKQKLIRIVRNEGARGISIKLRGRKNAEVLREKEGEISTPVVD